MPERVDGIDFNELELAQWGGISAPNVSPSNAARIYYSSLLDYLLASENGGDYSRLLTLAVASGLYLKLDQTTHQHVINGTPVFDEGIEATSTGDTAITANKDIKLKSGQKMIYDG